MLPITYLPPAKTYFKKLKDKHLKKEYKDTIVKIRKDPTIENAKTGDLAGIYGYDIFYRGTNYEIAYRVSETELGDAVVIIMAGTRENFWATLKRYMK